MSVEQIEAEVIPLAKKRHPDWVGEEWIEKGIQCFCHDFPGK
jgi:hypothetical protein